MELVASASGARQILAHFDTIGLDEKDLGLGRLDPAIRRSRQPLLISARVSIDLLERGAARLGQPDFGLRHGLWLNLRGLDSISLLWDHVGCLGEWYDLARRYIHLENNALSYDLTREGQDTVLIHDVVAMLRPVAVQITYAFVTLTVRVFRAHFGERWAPERMEFTCAAPSDLRTLRDAFRCRLEFGCVRNAVVVKTADLGQQLTHHGPELVSFMEANLKRLSAQHDADLHALVARAIALNLRGAAPSLAETAALLRIAPRTLQRRLAAIGTSHGRLLEEARRDVVAASRSTSGRIPLARLAFDLGLSDATAASRFIRTKVDA